MRRPLGASIIAGTLIVVSLMLGEIARAAEAQRQMGAATIVVGSGANGKTVSLHVGDTLVVRLPGNPTTGYSEGKPPLRRFTLTIHAR